MPSYHGYMPKARGTNEGVMPMPWWLWVLAVGAGLCLVISFFIIGGVDPRDWKGGGRKK